MLSPLKNDPNEPYFGLRGWGSRPICLRIKPHLAMSITARLSVGQLVGADDTIGDILAGDLQMQVGLGRR